MLKNWIGIFAVLALTACAPLAPSPGDQAVRIEGTPGMAVIYIVRTRPDLSYLTTQVLVDDKMVGATYAGTHLRVEVPAGRHRITGYGHDNGALTIDVASDRIYFVHHTVSGSWRVTNPHSFFRVMDEAAGRAAMARAPNGG
jgi:hypothetical protein